MPKVKMIQSTLGSNNGISSVHYLKDKEYEIGEDLANSFLSIKVCSLVVEQKAAIVPENKAVEPVMKKEVEEEKKGYLSNKKRGK